MTLLLVLSKLIIPEFRVFITRDEKKYIESLINVSEVTLALGFLVASLKNGLYFSIMFMYILSNKYLKDVYGSTYHFSVNCTILTFQILHNNDLVNPESWWVGYSRF